MVPCQTSRIFKMTSRSFTGFWLNFDPHKTWTFSGPEPGRRLSWGSSAPSRGQTCVKSDYGSEWERPLTTRRYVFNRSGSSLYKHFEYGSSSSLFRFRWTSRSAWMVVSWRDFQMFVHFCENREAVQKSSCFNVLYLIILPSASPTAIERRPQGSLMCILGGSLRETRREKEKKWLGNIAIKWWHKFYV